MPSPSPPRKKRGPGRPPGPPSTRLTLLIPNEVAEEIARTAKELRKPLGTYAREVLLEALKRRPRAQTQPNQPFLPACQACGWVEGADPAFDDLAYFVEEHDPGVCPRCGAEL